MQRTHALCIFLWTRVDREVLTLYQQRVAELVPRLQPPHIPAFCASLPAQRRGVVGGVAPGVPSLSLPPGQAASQPTKPWEACGEVPGGLRQRPAHAAVAAAPAALDSAGREAIQRQQNLQVGACKLLAGLRGGCDVSAAPAVGVTSCLLHKQAYYDPV